jgi:hypothetical protein
VSVASNVTSYQPFSSWLSVWEAFFWAQPPPFFFSRTSSWVIVRPVSAVKPSVASTKGPIGRSTDVDCLSSVAISNLRSS